MMPSSLLSLLMKVGLIGLAMPFAEYLATKLGDGVAREWLRFFLT